MAGPWEKYANQTETGPWSKYADAPPSNDPASYPQGKSESEAERMRREFMRKEKGNKTLGEKFKSGLEAVADYAESPVEGNVLTNPLGILPRSAASVLSSLNPASSYRGLSQEAIAGSFPGSSPSPAAQEELNTQSTETLKGLAAPFGLAGLSAMGESWGKNPIGSALTVAPYAKPSLRALKSGAGVAADLTRTGAQAAANKLTDMTLKQGTTLKPEIRRQNVQTAHEGGYLPNAKGVDKLAADIAATEGGLQSGIQAGQSAGVRGTLDRAIKNIEALREEANRSANPERSNALLDAEIDRLIRNPMTDETGTISAADIQKMKVEQGRDIKYQQKTGQAPDAFQAKIDKARVRGLKEELETQLFDVFPELKATNQKLSGMYKLQDVLERAASRIENNQGIGISLPIKSGAGAGLGSVFGPVGAAAGATIGTMIGIIEHPSVAPRLGQMLYRASRGKMTKAQAMTEAKGRVSSIIDKLKDQRGLVGRDINNPYPKEHPSNWEAVVSNRNFMKDTATKAALADNAKITPDGNIVLYHGTRSANKITKSGVLKQNSYLTTDYEVAKRYAQAAQQKGKPEVMEIVIDPQSLMPSGNKYYSTNEPVYNINGVYKVEPYNKGEQ